jgi:hypothetical protein
MKMNYYFDDRKLMAKFRLKRDLNVILDRITRIKTDKEIGTVHISTEKDSLLGFTIENSKILAEIYGCNIYFLKFFYYNISETFDSRYTNIYNEVWKQLENSLDLDENYYIIHIPSQNLNLLEKLNKSQMESIFCGGTINYIISKLDSPQKQKNVEITIKQLNVDDKQYYKTDLIKMGFESFKNYYSQYHISPQTRLKAPVIYENWIRRDMGKNDVLIVCAFYKEKPVAFLTVEKESGFLELVLSAVRKEMRGKRVYGDLIRFATNMGVKNDKFIVTSTQIDNYGVQSAWIDIGYKPYYTYYTFHLGNISTNNG